MFCTQVVMVSLLLYILLQIIMVFRTKNSCRVYMTSTTQLWLIYWSEHTSALITHRRFPSIYHISNLWVTSIWRLSTTSSQAATPRSSLQHFIVSCLPPLWYDKASRWMFNTQAICQVTKRPISNNINQETWESMHLLVYFLLLLSVLSKKCFYRASIIQKRIFLCWDGTTIRFYFEFWSPVCNHEFRDHTNKHSPPKLISNKFSLSWIWCNIV